jgi:hypothetical protein
MVKPPFPYDFGGAWQTSRQTIHQQCLYNERQKRVNNLKIDGQMLSRFSLFFGLTITTSQT